MNVSEVMEQLEAMGSAQTRKIFAKHGAPEKFFGVKVGDMKTLVKKIKKDQPLAEELYATGNADAMYFAGLISDPQAIDRALLDRWAKDASWYMVSEYTVAGVAAESPHGWEAGMDWIESDAEHVATSGWATLAGVVSHWADERIDLDALRSLLARVESTIHDSPNRVRYTMNGFVIAVGCYIEELSAEASRVAAAIGKVHVDMGGTACKVPLATDYIKKVVDKGRLGKKRKYVRC